MHARFRLLAFLPLLCLLGAAACATNPATGKRELAFLPVGEEIRMGEEQLVPRVHAQGGGYTELPELRSYVNDVGRRLAAVSDRPDLPYEFVVIDNRAANVWSLPGGKIGITRGLLVRLEDESQLAAVLSHELAHLSARHAAKQVERDVIREVVVTGATIAAAMAGIPAGPFVDLAFGGIRLGAGLAMHAFGRGDEVEADRYALVYMQRAGYDLRAALEVQDLLLRAGSQHPEWRDGLVKLHPQTRARLQANRHAIAALRQRGELHGERYADRFAAATSSLRLEDAAQRAYDLGRGALAAGDAEAALGFANAALEADPDEPHFHGLRADALLEQHRFVEAVASYDDALEREPDHAPYFLRRGMALKEMGAHGLAHNDFTRSEALFPNALARAELHTMRKQMRGLGGVWERSLPPVGAGGDPRIASTLRPVEGRVVEGRIVEGLVIEDRALEAEGH